MAPRSRKSAKGVGLTLMLVGASGTGRTTFANTLVESALIDHRELDTPDRAHLEGDGVKIKPYQVELEEDGVRISLNLYDTPGFGDAIDNEAGFAVILDHLEKQFDEILAMESRVRRNTRAKDNRIHCLIYFITPTGHSLRELDIVLMRKLSARVNIIPVIGRADSLTPTELKQFKKRIMEDIDHYKIPIYSFPYDVEQDDEETCQENAELHALLPFAIVGSEEEVEIDGEPVRVRRYPWGHVEVDNPKHSDFSSLRHALFSSHLTELKEVTHEWLYESYRTEKLSEATGHDGDLEADMAPGDVASQGVRLREDQLRKEEEKLREVELRVQREIAERRQELLAKEELLRSLEAKIHAQAGAAGDF